ncbi:restriction endonuclease subunit S [Streptomyces sp. NBC_00247]|uniref:restriction endonuclease subunit S n=1 Tax=Streptomyces sp. NBC_00247 TaxID=2975689 RepID=UPI002E2E1ADB|nr:restriction endonuclease subunit S [Streptomyces sp. NBC_00247]
MSLAWQVRVASGAEALPAGWGVRRVRDLVHLINGYPFPSESFGPTGDIPLVRIRDLGSQGFETYLNGPVPPASIVRDGDVVIGMDGDFNLKVWDKGRAALNQRLCLLRPRPGVDVRFVAYALPSSLRIINDLTFATTVKHLSSGDVLSERIALPPLDEQRRIADFLDAETARIDRLVELQRGVIDRLDERESAQLDRAIDELISRSGTVPLRRFVWSVDQGASPQCEAVPAAEDEWGVLKVSCLRPGVFHPEENKRLPDAIRPERASEVREGDLLITRANTPQLVGSTAVVRGVRRKLLLSDKIFRVRLSEGMTPDFVAVIARGSRIRSLSAAGSNGASQSMANIRFDEVKGWPMPAVGVRAQQDLVDRVSRGRQQLDALRPAINRQIDLLTERRQALVTAAVTGRFDVSTAGNRNATDGVNP